MVLICSLVWLLANVLGIVWMLSALIRRKSKKKSLAAFLVALVAFAMVGIWPSDDPGPTVTRTVEQSLEAEVETAALETEPVTEPTVVETTTVEETTPEATTEAVETTTVEETTTVAETTEERETVPEKSSFSIHFIDVGQADSALVECDGHYMLIDGGNADDSQIIYSVLKKAKVPKLDIIVGTHGHEDHIGGLPGALNYTTADLTLCSVTSYDSKAFNNFKKYADKNGGGIKVPAAGDTYKLGSAKVEILGVNGGSSANDTSIVLMVRYGKNNFLFAGDAEYDAEQAVMRRDVDLDCDVLKVGHHGSDTSSGYQFIWKSMPKYAIISVGKGNSYGHPTDAALSRFRDADAKVYRTDLQGDIYVTSDGTNVTVTSDKNSNEKAIMTPGGYSETKAETKATKETTKAADKGSSSGGSTDYILNTNTKKFHYPNCSSVKQMKEKNKKAYSGSRDDVIAQGYKPCQRCNP